MNSGKPQNRWIFILLVASLACVPALASDAVTSAGAIVGVVTNASNGPVVHATVTARKADGSSIRATLSGADGLYAFADLPAGTWSISAHVDGIPDITVSVNVEGNSAARSDLVLAIPNPPAGGPVTAAAAVAATLPSVPRRCRRQTPPRQWITTRRWQTYPTSAG